MKNRILAALAIGFFLMAGCGESRLEKRARLEEENTAAEPLTLEQRAVAGDAVAQYNLGVMYYEGQGVEQNFKDAAKWFRKAAEQENAIAQINLGLMYLRGKGVPEDLKEAAKWFRKAAEQGNAMAQHSLGFMYGKGDGVLQDDVTAYAWWDISAANGQEKAKKFKDLAAKELTAEEIAKAEALVKEMVKKNPKLLKKKE